MTSGRQLVSKLCHDDIMTSAKHWNHCNFRSQRSRREANTKQQTEHQHHHHTFSERCAIVVSRSCCVTDFSMSVMTCVYVCVIVCLYQHNTDWDFTWRHRKIISYSISSVVHRTDTSVCDRTPLGQIESRIASVWKPRQQSHVPRSIPQTLMILLLKPF